MGAVFNQDRKLTWSLTAVYVAIVAALASHHVLWRDEARALNIVTASSTLRDLFQNLRNEGHPALWYLVLYAGYQITRSTLVLKASSVLAATAAVFVFLARSPFPSYQKALFVFGGLPLFLYSVYCRSYCLTMLFLILYAAVHRSRFEKPFAVAWALALLANTHALALILAGALWCALVVESVAVRATMGGGRRGLRIVLAHALTAVALVVSVLPLPPDRTTTVTPLYHFDAPSAIRAAAHALLHTGDILASGFGVDNGYFVTFMFLALAVYLLRQPALALALVLATTGFVVFSALIYPLQGYQKCLLVLLVVVLLWLDAENEPRRWTSPWLSGAIEALGRARAPALSLLLLMHLALGISSISIDASRGVSSSRGLGMYLRHNEELREAIVMGEPGNWMESLHYYATNRIYFAREERFGTWAHFTTESRATLTLNELLAIAERLQGEQGKPVVIAMGYRLSAEGPFQIPGVFGSRFVYTPDSLAQWHERTTLLAEFRGSLGDENYDLYLVTPQGPRAQ